MWAFFRKGAPFYMNELAVELFATLPPGGQRFLSDASPALEEE